MKSTFVCADAAKSKEVTYPYFVRGGNTGRILLVIDPRTAITLHPGNYTDPMLYVIEMYNGFFCTENGYPPAHGTLTIELP